jgi:hypothetical protein
MPAKASIQKSLKFLDSGSRWLPRQLARNDADRPMWSAVKICGAETARLSGEKKLSPPIPHK